MDTGVEREYTPRDRGLPVTQLAPSVVTTGTRLFAEALAEQAVPSTHATFTPPLEGPATTEALVRLLADPRLDQANSTALERVLAVRPHLVDVRPAAEVLGLRPGEFHHAGPPVSWEQAAGPLRGALIGAMLFEDVADTPDEAERRLATGEARFSPCHHHGGVGPMAGLVSPSMWLMELADASTGQRSWCSLNEGLGKVLRYGAYGTEVTDRLRWMSTVLGPLMQDAVRAHGPIDIGAILAQMVQMGDEAHNRNRAGTLMLMRELVPHLVSGDAPTSRVAEVIRFIGGNDHFFLNAAMPAAKLMMDAGRNIPGSTLVVAMARNGTDFGIQVSGTGNRWFTAPAELPDGLFLGEYGPEDANPDIGDSTIAETAGLGGFVMATAPAIVKFVGGDTNFALRTSQLMYEITLAENPALQLPILGFRGAPTGIDVTRVCTTGILPQINTGMAGKIPGTGQVGAGLVKPPAACFIQALTALAAEAPELPQPTS
ncbi:DUF1116 domain-containing protein [Lipingzhangella sp. LS1_29]|uniref:DUF1116 domain-containing protein n=1 Tax=Lipingzhangella rawalii TaxID=2055835 RepID=A0ABU2HAY8_9ACTN|nr:DUF1116 domain-containing protein [Lipingzhangella rawalii]MDS1272485.1 DUF1116 domain-containing protein [Lipingzhangella rawalii]